MMRPRLFRRATVICCVPILSAAACHALESDPREMPPLVRVALAAPAEADGRFFTGVVAARVQSDLGFRVGGKVTERLVDVGQSVRRGQILMRIDPADLRLATAAQAQATAAARALAARATADERRYRDLVAAGAVSASTYDQAKASALSAEAQLAGAQAQARIASNEAAYAILRAGTDGVVMNTLVEPGQVVAAGQPVLRLAQAGAREAVVNLPEPIRPAIGSIARTTLYDGGVDGFARLRQLSGAADPRTRTFEARYVLQGRAAQAPLGATVRITMASVGGQPPIRVPLSALYDAGRGPGIWIVDRKSRVSWRPVTIATLSEESAQIGGGIAPGDRFVTMGAHLLHQGQQVRISTGRDGGL